MFAKAMLVASRFTKPVIVLSRHADKSVHCSGGAFVVLNEEGWIVTAAHLLGSFLVSPQEARDLRGHQTLTDVTKLDGRKTDTPAPHQVTDHSVWWGWEGVAIKDVQALPDADLFVGRLEPFERSRVGLYPVIKDPSKNLDPGTSLCKLGYPFHEIDASFDENNGIFKLAQGVLPLPLFPLEGIYTRNAEAGRTPDGRYAIKFLETSSPGLRGQSGGPVFDVDGTVWAIQSRTAHFPLGFSPKVLRNGKEIEEHQFLNVGLGVHPETLVAFLRENRIPFRLSGY